MKTDKTTFVDFSDEKEVQRKNEREGEKEREKERTRERERERDEIKVNRAITQL